jgi:SAM-dependent methyltransferase
MNHWNQHAHQWNFVGHPLRPNQTDTNIFQQLVLPENITTERFEVLLLGVTPEITSIKWPVQTHLLAVDQNEDMIKSVWEKYNFPPNFEAKLGDWQDMPINSETCDLAIGDGCFTLINYPDGYHAVLRSIHRILKPQRKLAMRFFSRPEKPESLETVFEDLWSNKIGNFHVFKWRLAMALHGDLLAGVTLENIWSTWDRHVPNPDELTQRLGWAAAEVATINVYKNIPTVYTFPTLTEIREIFGQYFQETSCCFPDYEIGQRCPIMIFERTE